jgi:biopolymer transport protein ExbB/TolQ
MHSFSLDLMHLITSYLLQPVIWGLLFFIALAVYEIGLAFGERFTVIKALVKGGHKKQLIEQGKRRIERADFITRIAPMLGLMGTLIPLGPGLSALGTGDISILTTAMTVAFDTTIIGLLAGVIGFVLGRMRRRWYDNAMLALSEQALAQTAKQEKVHNQTQVTIEKTRSQHE